MYLSGRQKFILILVPILFVGTWITLGIVNSIQNPAPYRPNSREIFEDTCIEKGGVPNTDVNGDNWECKKI